MIDNSLLIAFSSVIQEGSFEKAAKKINLTSSAVSQKIKQLETLLGAVLLIRGKPCVATDVGNQLYNHAEKIYFLEHEFFDRLSTDCGPYTGSFITLRIAVNADSVGTWFTKALSKFNTTHNCLFDLVIDDENHTSEMLRTGSVLAAISVEKKPIQGFKSLYLGSFQYTAVASPAFYKRYFRNEGVHLKSLQAAPCISFNRKDPLQNLWLKSNFGSDDDIKSHWIPSSHGYLNSCLEGLGWGLNPRLSTQEHLADGSLIELIPDTDVNEPLYWQYSQTSGKLMQKLTDIIEVIACEKLPQ
jgi:LysR family transcriptional regulator (chromosome initiation inhibitor)